MPKWLAPIVLVCVIVVIGLGWFFGQAVISKWITNDEPNNNGVGEAITTPLMHDIPESSKSEEFKTKSRIAGASTDFSKWENSEKFEPRSDGGRELCPLFRSRFPEGRTMYSPDVVGSRFKGVISVKPISQNRENIVFEFRDIFRCVIGNGNYRHIACEAAPYGTGYLIENNQNIRQPWINRPNDVKPGTVQFLTATSEPAPNSELLRVELNLRFIPADSVDGEYKTRVFEYNIPTGGPAEQLQGQIGLGIIDPKKYRPYQPDEACAEFISFEIYRQPSKINNN